MTVALVTGAKQSIGEACARRLAADGCTVAVTDISREGAERVAASIGGGAIGLALDVRDPVAVAAVVGEVVDRLGGLDVAVNNAGVSETSSPVVAMSDETWRQVLSVNLDGVFHCVREEIGAMRERGGGAIVNMASTLGSVGFPGHAAYVASKHGVVGLTKAAALDHAADGIRVNAVAPAFVSVPAKTRSHSEEEVAGLHPLGRLATVEEVAGLVSWLLSDAAAFATGAVYPLDGGFLAR